MSICRVCHGRGHVVAVGGVPTCSACRGRGVQPAQAEVPERNPDPVGAALRAEARTERGGFAQVMGRQRRLVVPDPTRPRSRYGTLLHDGRVSYRLDGGETVTLNLDGSVEASDGMSHDHRRTRESWTRASHSETREALLLSSFAEGRPLSWHEREALLDYLAVGHRLDAESVGDPDHLSSADRRELAGLRHELEAAISARPLPAQMLAWWAPRPDLTGVSEVGEPQHLPAIRWPALMVCSLERPTTASGPVYQVNLPQGAPALWTVPEVGPLCGQHLLLGSGMSVEAVGRSTSLVTETGSIRPVIMATVSRTS